MSGQDSEMDINQTARFLGTHRVNKLAEFRVININGNVSLSRCLTMKYRFFFIMATTMPQSLIPLTFNNNNINNNNV